MFLVNNYKQALRILDTKPLVIKDVGLSKQLRDPDHIRMAYHVTI